MKPAITLNDKPIYVIGERTIEFSDYTEGAEPAFTRLKEMAKDTKQQLKALTDEQAEDGATD